MIVSRETFFEFINQAKLECNLAVDTETTGLNPYQSDSLFSIIFGGEKGVWYLNFNPYENLPENFILDNSHIEILQKEIFNDTKRRYFFHNAKFDLAFLHKRGLVVSGRIHDTKSIHRLIDNEAFQKFSLENCAKVAGFNKSEAVEEFIAENDLWDWEQVPGRDKRTKKKYYDAVPFDIMSSYGLTDGKITYGLGMWQLARLRELENEAKNIALPGYGRIYQNECELTTTVFEMEKRGVQLDIDYCKRAVDIETKRLDGYCDEFKTLTGKDLEISPKLFAEIFSGEEITFGKPTATGKQNPVFDSDALSGFKHPAAQTILKYRDTKSTLDFFQGFLYFADSSGVIHTSFHQDGTVTGRFASSNPNLQNLKKDTEESLKEEVVTRRAIVPRKDFCFAMFDYDQMEYRLMLDYTGSKALIDKVLGGLDVHQATADVAKVTRAQAKTTNFAVLYGSGLLRLSRTLKIGIEEAERLRNAIFDAAPEIKELIEEQIYLADTRHYIVNWVGRRCRFPLIQTDRGKIRMSYKAVNSLIQGGCADIVKIAMNKIASFLQDKRSKLVLTIHDELVIETHRDELAILPEIKRIMETAYPHRHLPLTVGVEHSFRSLADKIEGFPTQWQENPKPSLELESAHS